MTVEVVQSLGIQSLDNLYGQMVTAAGINQPAAGVPSGVGFPGASTRQTSKGVAVRFKRVQGFLSPTTGATSPSWYPFCRIPSNAIILGVETILVSGTITTFTGDITAAFSDAFDGTPYQYQIAGPPSGLSAAPGNALILNPATTATGLSGANALFAQSFAFANLISPVSPKTFATTPVVTVYNQGWTDVTFGGPGGVGVFGNGFPQTLDQPLWQAAGFTQDQRANYDIGVLSTATNNVSSAVLGLRVTYLDGQAA